MNADGTHLRRLAYTDVLGDWPTMGVSFSPDGKTIVYGAFPKSAATTGEPIIDIMNADGTGQRLLPRSYGFGWPCHSPDGRQIVCLSDVHHQICVVSADGTHWRQLTHVAEGVYDAANWGPHVR
jgi:Tol biopolymer transport system component